jgi:glucose-6-phosphate dehydrogenase assembly protein OpcA
MDGSRDAYAEVIEICLCGSAIEHPASIVLPLLVSDLPVFCRWRGEPEWASSQLAELLGVVDRLVVNSSEWRGLPNPYERLFELFDRVAVSDIAFSRTLAWRAKLAEQWPGIARIKRLGVVGPKADALLLAGWLRARLKRRIVLSWRGAQEVRAVRVDGKQIDPPVGGLESGSDLLSGELDSFGRDPIYEAAVRAAI